ncbi:MAG: SH3 domain-containing protein, partial [Chloroflexota bacterium]
SGAFTYTPRAGTTQEVDGFRYRAFDETGQRFIGLVCITRSDLTLNLPGQQQTSFGQTIPIQGISVDAVNNASTITMTLTVGIGTLSTDFPDNSNLGPSAADECNALVDSLRTVDDNRPATGGASLPDLSYIPKIVRDTAPQNVRPEPIRVAFQGALIDGNGTRTITVSGTEEQVNAVVATTKYTAPAAAAVSAPRTTDSVVVIANEGNNEAQGQIVIIISDDVSPRPGSSGDDVDAVVATIPQDTIPLGPSTLFEISQFENTVINGESTVTTVTDGDVWVRVLATNGELIDPGAIGDPFLLEQAIFNSADVYGLTVGGSTVTNFNLTVLVCLRGQGTFYFRDAATSPRTTRVLPSTFDGVFTCAFIPNAGTVVLVGRRADAQLADNTALFELDAATLPEGCMVTTDDIINLREGPGMDDEIIRRIPFDVTLTAFEQSGQWYFVDYLGLRGWMSADFVTPNDFC